MWFPNTRLLPNRRLCVLLLLFGLGLSGCSRSRESERPESTNETFQEENTRLKAELADTRSKLERTIAECQQLRQEYASSQQRQRDKLKAEKRKRHEAGLPEGEEEQESGFLDRLGNGEMTTDELKAMIALGSSRERVKELLDAPDAMQHGQWVYKRWQVRDSGIADKTYVGFWVSFGPDEKVSDFGFLELD